MDCEKNFELCSCKAIRISQCFEVGVGHIKEVKGRWLQLLFLIIASFLFPFGKPSFVPYNCFSDSDSPRCSPQIIVGYKLQHINFLY